MAAFINTNTASLNAQRNLNSSQGALATSLQRLSSGLRINSAKDDAAGLAISERMTSQIRGSDQAARNANDGISLAQTAEGDLTQIGTNLQRMRELAVQSANATNTASDRAALDGEVQSLAAEIDRVSQGSAFNGVKLLDGSFRNQTFQIGAGNTTNDQITMGSINSARTSSLGGYQGYNAQTVGVITGSATSSTLSIAKAGGPGAGTVSIANVLNDGKAIASAINNSGVAGLTATVSATTKTGATTGSAPITANGVSTFTLNGTTINVNSTSGESQSTTQAAAFNAINAQSGNTGVVATDNGAGGLSLSAADGRNIAVGTFATTATGATAGNLGLTGSVGATFSSTVMTSYVDTPGSGTSSVTISGAGAAGSGAVAIGSAGTAIAATNVLTAAGANAALTSIDAALTSVNNSRASLGAYQNRFASVVSSLQTTSENLSSSRSRIQDTDFAHETAQLTRGQILQQAGTAMLAQANSLPNGVLALLRG